MGRLCRGARLVVALGGNSLGVSPAEQATRLRVTAPMLVDLVDQGYEIVITHGNGPQVGLISSALARAAASGAAPEGFDLSTSTAMSQGYIGYHLQQALEAEVRRRGGLWKVVSVVTQVLTDPDDPAYASPTKPVGSFVSCDEARRMMEADPSLTMVEDSGRGWRPVVPSPRPQEILEIDSVLSLIDHGFIVITCGGGGIPVVEKGDGSYAGVSAVIDKDLTSAVLAKSVDASMLVILTSVPRVAVNFGTPEQQALSEITVDELDSYVAEGQFAPGSMLPKILAAREFVVSAPGRSAVICDLMEVTEALRGAAGTLVHA